MRIKPASRQTKYLLRSEIKQHPAGSWNPTEKPLLVLQHKFLYYPIKELAKFRQSKKFIMVDSDYRQRFELQAEIRTNYAANVSGGGSRKKF